MKVSKFSPKTDLKLVKESDLQNRFLGLLKQNDILYYKTHGGLAYMKIGDDKYIPKTFQKNFPDVIIFDNYGRAIFVEFKTEVNKLSSNQKVSFERLVKQRFHIFIFRPSHFNYFYDLITNQNNQLGLWNMLYQATHWPLPEHTKEKYHE